MFPDILQTDNLKNCNTAMIFFNVSYTTRICEVQHMGQYTWYTFIKKGGGGGVYRNIPVHHCETRIECGIAFNREHTNRQAKSFTR